MGWSKGLGRGRAWRKQREAVLRRDSKLCQPCRARGAYTAAMEVDHILGLAEGGTDQSDNLQAICVPCHKAKTHNPNGCNADGTPLKSNAYWG